MPKNIVILSDGTSQTLDQDEPTNVAKMFKYIQKDPTKQVASYDPGLGTGLFGFFGKAFGIGISRNIQESYKFLVKQYEMGDQIYLFGYSRGAYTVRSLSGFTNMFGILAEPQDDLIEEAYNIYQKGVNPRTEIDRTLQERRENAEAFRKRHAASPCKITFIGVWDTVGALGFPYRPVGVLLDQLPLFRYTFHDTTISSNVRSGYHALSIDDERRTFLPTLWDEMTERELQQKPHVEQAWFVGSHGDVGGGNEKPGRPSLSDISLEWMINRAKDHGLLLEPDYQTKLNPNAMATLHNSREGIARLYTRASRKESEGLDRLNFLNVHQSVFERRRTDQNYRPWIFDEDDTLPPVQEIA